MTHIQINAPGGNRRFSEAVIAVPILVLVFALVIGVFSKLGFVNSLGWAVVYLAAAIWFAVTAKRTLLVTLKFWPLLVLPAIALLSASWSMDPASTLRTGTQLAFSTLLGLRLADAVSPRLAVNSLFGASAIGIFLSVLAVGFPPLQPVFENNGALIGAYPQKTVAGVAFTLFALSSAAAFALSGYRWMGLMLALACVPFIVMTKSVSAMILLAGLGVVLFQGPLSRGQATHRFAALLFVLGVSALLALGTWISSVDIVDEFLSLVGKGRSLTGRTDIWAIGLEVARDHPVLGTGYAAFWGNPDFSADWGYLHAAVDPRLKGFHSTYIEALVTTGVLGVLAVVITYYWITVRALLWYLETGRMEAALWLTIMLSALALSFVDNVLFGEHEFFHFVAAMAFVFTGKRVSSLRFRMAPTAMPEAV